MLVSSPFSGANFPPFLPWNGGTSGIRFVGFTLNQDTAENLVDHSQASEWISQRHDSATGTNEWAYVDLGSATDFNVPYIRWRTDKKYLPVHWKVETANSSSGPWSTQAEFDNSLEWKWPIAGPVRRTGRFCLPLRGEWQ